ncbi:MAG: pyridine nucleotide-disulfide oxidoreductase [Spirochaetaceae bacterium 4572_7]|nr:MAG: pyridine nucleotide-disulfide oxidoreductase [Spirochaetaceae bacterium 4572_7]
MKNEYDVVVIGAGPAGLAAAVAAADRGATVCLAEREERMGGILKQCIHDGFGLIRFEEKLTGPEYAWRYEQMVKERKIDFMDSTFLTQMSKNNDIYDLSFVNPKLGQFDLKSKSMIMAMGCRERTDRQIFLHGERPAGVFTAGQAQNFINLKGFMPGKKCVILGSGDIGLIMARRLTIEGAEVLGVYELGSEPSGLTRNIVQCLEDFKIPLELSTTVTEIHGKDRVEAVTVCKVDKNRVPITESAIKIQCDTLILSVGLIPENDILKPLSIEMDRVTRGPLVDQNLETSKTGLFSCGNALHVSDLVDYVSESGKIAGNSAADYLSNIKKERSRLPFNKKGNLLYLVPQFLNLPSKETIPLFFRPKKAVDSAYVVVKQDDKVILKKRLNWLKPSEMHRIPLDLGLLNPEGGSPTLSVLSKEELDD